MGYAVYKLSKEDAAIFNKLTEKCWNGKERDLSKLNQYERAVLLKLMEEAGEYKPGSKPERTAKSFSETVKKFNPHHGKDGRFTTKPGGGGGMDYSKVIDGVDVPDHILEEGEESVQQYVQLKQQVDGSRKKIQGLKAALPNSKVSLGLSSFDDEVLQNTTETVQKVVDKYPVVKNAVKGLRSSEESVEPLSDSTMGAYDRGSGYIYLSKNYYKDKNAFTEKYDETVKKKFHPEGTDYNSVIVHEMAHAIDFYLSDKKGRAVSNDIQKRISMLYQKAGKRLDAATVIEGLSEYATFNSREFFAEAMAEYIMIDNPREIAKMVGQQVDIMIQYL